MPSFRNKLYTLLIIACGAGYAWLYYNLNSGFVGNSTVEVCLFKHVTNIPCPSCGSTRSVISLLNGDFSGALLQNPLGYLIALILSFAPIWILADLITKKQTFLHAYQKMETQLRKTKYATPLALVVIVNWIWNISKGL